MLTSAEALEKCTFEMSEGDILKINSTGIKTGCIMPEQNA